jgi:catechol 2,3-dioxygenase-like lactoylglutathione lyase family enzyme
MGVRVSELVLESRDPQRLADFWCEVLGFEIVGHEDDGGIEIGPAAGFGGLQPTIILSPNADPDRSRGRLHIDVSPVGDATRSAEVERILRAGGHHADIGQLGTEPWTVLQDPEGNVFCVLDAPIPDA